MPQRRRRPPRPLARAPVRGARPRFTVRPRKGQFVVFDKPASKLLHAIILPVPTERTKGVVACRTAFGNLLVGGYGVAGGGISRVTPAGQVYVIEPNVNPNIARDDEVAQSADKVGISYPALIRMLVNQAVISFQIWTGITPEAEVMRDALEEFLGI